MMTLGDILDRLASADALRQRHGVGSIGVFGSFARGENRADSDVDVLVEFNRPIGLIEFAALRRELSNLLGRPVDLITLDAIRTDHREAILRDLRRAA
jgi:predicted nucleotidyltransferase